MKKARECSKMVATSLLIRVRSPQSLLFLFFLFFWFCVMLFECSNPHNVFFFKRVWLQLFIHFYRSVVADLRRQRGALRRRCWSFMSNECSVIVEILVAVDQVFATRVLRGSLTICWAVLRKAKVWAVLLWGGGLSPRARESFVDRSGAALGGGLYHRSSTFNFFCDREELQILQKNYIG